MNSDSFLHTDKLADNAEIMLIVIYRGVVVWYTINVEVGVNYIKPVYYKMSAMIFLFWFGVYVVQVLQLNQKQKNFDTQQTRYKIIQYL